MAITALIPRDYQQLLIDRGYDLGAAGADGVWGSKTGAASEAWFEAGENLIDPERPREPASEVIADEWLPDCHMSRVIGHWTAGSYTVSAVDREHYHFIVGGNLQIAKGDNSIEDNVSTADRDYAAHTLGCNTGSIGIAVACMAGAKESPFVAGAFPMLETQWLMLAAVAADCCRKYGIAVTPTTVLTHGEVEQNLGIKQRGKWDIMKAPWTSLSGAQLNDLWRKEVAARL